MSGKLFNFLCYMPPGVTKPRVPYRVAMFVVGPLMAVDRFYWQRVERRVRWLTQ